MFTIDLTTAQGDIVAAFTALIGLALIIYGGKTIKNMIHR